VHRGAGARRSGVTGGAVSAGIDFALGLAAKLFDIETAEQVQLHLEYAPDPPFAAGTPDTAPPEVLATVRQCLAEVRAERERIVGAVSVGA
jgi:cyclohexyl-isocyanide hydratase